MVASAVVAVCASPRGVGAIPVELFDQKSELVCGGDGECHRALRSRSSVGSYLGVSVRGEGRTSASIKVDGDEVSVRAEGTALRGIYLSWDGDTYPEQLSSSGLGCYDLQQDGASAIILKGFDFEGECAATEGSSSCSVLVETRVYDSVDPTGQTYSASLLRLPEGKESGDLLVPFSNLIRKGPRGAARLSCVGALTIFIQTIGYASFEFELNSIFTNSRLALTPAPTRVAAATPAPTSIPTNTPSPAATATTRVSPTPLPAQSPQVIATNGGAPIAASEKGSEGSVVPKESSKGPPAQVVVPSTPTRVNPTPAVAPSKPLAPAVVSDEEEAVYGEVIRR